MPEPALVTVLPKLPVLAPLALVKVMFAGSRLLIRLLLASLAVKVTVTLEPEATDALETLTVDCERLRSPGLRATTEQAKVRPVAEALMYSAPEAV